MICSTICCSVGCTSFSTDTCTFRTRHVFSKICVMDSSQNPSADSVDFLLSGERIPALMEFLEFKFFEDGEAEARHTLDDRQAACEQEHKR